MIKECRIMIGKFFSGSFELILSSFKITAPYSTRRVYKQGQAKCNAPLMLGEGSYYCADSDFDIEWIQ